MSANSSSRNPLIGDMFDHPQQDFAASVVVFLVALPLCMGVAIASGVDPARGLITGIVGGIIVGYFAGCPLQVSGPAAGLTVLIFEMVVGARNEYIARSADFETLTATAQEAIRNEAAQYALVVLGIVGFLAGLIQMALAVARMGRWFRAVSPAVIHGMLAGIGVLIMASQFHVMLDDEPRGKGFKNLYTIPDALYNAFAPETSVTHQLAAATGIITILTIVLWQKFATRRLKTLPGPLVAIIVAIIFNQTFQFGIKTVELSDNLYNEMTFPTMLWWDLLFQQSIWISAIAIAAIASAETLLCATAVDQIQDGPRTKYEQELFGQGIGNSICGLLGGLPMTGVIVRSSANIQAGARTRLSAMLHGVWLLLFVAVLPWMLEYVPTSALAAILVYTGYKLANYKTFLNLWKVGRSEALIFLTTVVVIVVQDLLVGIITGLILSLFKMLLTFSRLECELRDGPGNRVDLKLQGACTFVRLPHLAETLEKVPPGAELHVDLSQVDYVDHACLEQMINWARQHERTGGSLVMDWESLHARFRRYNDTTTLGARESAEGPSSGDAKTSPETNGDSQSGNGASTDSEANPDPEATASK